MARATKETKEKKILKKDWVAEKMQRVKGVTVDEIRAEFKCTADAARCLIHDVKRDYDAKVERKNRTYFMVP